jgi:hypothetical protein
MFSFHDEQAIIATKKYILRDFYVIRIIFKKMTLKLLVLQKCMAFIDTETFSKISYWRQSNWTLNTMKLRGK